MKNLLSIFILSLTWMSCAQGQSPTEQLQKDLSSGKSSIGDVLTSHSYMPLHSQESFRQLIKKNARQGAILLVTPEEPGTRIKVKGKITDKSHQLNRNSLVYVYHTDNRGWYSDTAGHVSGNQGDRMHARLFGYFRTMDDGSFEFNTIHPQGYPHSDLPQHIHFEVFSNDGNALLITELLFDDDKRLTPSMRQRMAQEGALIASNTSTENEPMYNYEIVVNK